MLGGWQFSGLTTFETGNPFSAANPVSDNTGVANGFWEWNVCRVDLACRTFDDIAKGGSNGDLQ